MRFVIPIIKEGDGTTFNRGALGASHWAGRWKEHFLRQRYPRTWMVRKVLNNVRDYFTTH
jgi:hypothetical protein